MQGRRPGASSGLSPAFRRTLDRAKFLPFAGSEIVSDRAAGIALGEAQD